MHRSTSPADGTAAGTISTTTHRVDLKRRIESFLAGRNLPGLRQLNVRVDDGVVLLSGRVRSFYEKQLANHCCRRVAGVLEVIDSVDVTDPTAQPAKAATPDYAYVG